MKNEQMKEQSVKTHMLSHIHTLLCDITVIGLNFKITFILEKHVVEDNVLFTNHLAGK